MKKFFRHGLIIGKFYPLHAGHSHLIRTALASCERLTVLVIASSTDSIPLEKRVSWVQGEHPNAVVRSALDDGRVDFSSPAAWDQHMAVAKGLLDSAVDAVFTSSPHGAELARRLKARWIQVDPDRRHTPVSGTAVRNDPAGYWWALTPAVRQYLAQRVVVVGSESSGTTELAQQLAERFEVPWVPEFGREWSAIRPGGLWAPWHAAEFEFISREQLHAEAEALRATPKPLVICDGDLLSTALWNERHLGPGHRAQAVLKQAMEHPPLVYLLTGDDVPASQPREDEAAQRRMQSRFRDVLQGQNTPWFEIRGGQAKRIAEAKTAVDGLLADAFHVKHPLERSRGFSQPKNVAERR